MKVDLYRSESMPDYTIIVPAGTDLKVFEGAVATTAKILAPLVVARSDVELEEVLAGDVLESVSAQIANERAGLIQTVEQYCLLDREDAIGSDNAVNAPDMEIERDAME